MKAKYEANGMPNKSDYGELLQTTKEQRGFCDKIEIAVRINLITQAEKERSQLLASSQST